MHECAQLIIRIIEQQMDMVAHQAPCDDTHAEFLLCTVEEVEKLPPIGIIFEDRLLVVAAAHHMVVPGLRALSRGPHGKPPPLVTAPMRPDRHMKPTLGYQACMEEGWILMPAPQMR